MFVYKNEGLTSKITDDIMASSISEVSFGDFLPMT